MKLYSSCEPSQKGGPRTSGYIPNGFCFQGGRYSRWRRVGVTECWASKCSTRQFPDIVNTTTIPVPPSWWTEQWYHNMLGFPSLFNDVPSQTTVIKHVLLTTPTPIKQRTYWVSPAKREIIKQEVEYILQNGFAVPSSSSWSSPCLLDTKSDGTPRFCTDFRKVNSVTVPDAHPLPLIDDWIDEIGPAKYIAKLDMLKGYWQVPFTREASDISAFVTPDHFLQFVMLLQPFRDSSTKFWETSPIVEHT